MPRRDWNAKLDREYERLYEQLARAEAAKLGPRRPVRSLPDVRARRPRPRQPAAPPDRRCSLSGSPTFGSGPNASFGQMTVVTSR